MSGAGVIDDPSARSPNRFFIEMKLGMKLLVATNDMKDDKLRLRVISEFISIKTVWPPRRGGTADSIEDAMRRGTVAHPLRPALALRGMRSWRLLGLRSKREALSGLSWNILARF